MAAYIALVHKGHKDANFGVTFPDFPGCVTAGYTLSDMLAMAGAALALHIRGMVNDGDRIPVPSSLDEIMAAPYSKGGVAVLIQAPEQKAVIEVKNTLDELAPPGGQRSSRGRAHRPRPLRRQGGKVRN